MVSVGQLLKNVDQSGDLETTRDGWQGRASGQMYVAGVPEEWQVAWVG